MSGLGTKRYHSNGDKGQRFLICALLVVTIFALLSGCTNGKFAPITTGNSDVKNADVINIHGSIEGLEKIDQFYEDTTKNVKSKVRLVQYTIEGAPIITDVSNEDGIISVKHDSTRDPYGGGSVNTYTCNQFLKEENPTNLSYFATGCNGNELGMDEILFVGYNMKQQDLFEIQLMYGKDLENNINTIDKKLSKVVSKDQTLHKEDFDFSPSIKQELYKKLVLANYLDEKSLRNRCEKTGKMKYKLKVKINGAALDFTWDACNDSEEAREMTDIAQFIIKSSENSQPTKREEIVQGYVVDIQENELLVAQDMTAFNYQLIKDTSLTTLINEYNLQLIYLRGLPTNDYRKGDKISAIIKGERNEETMPGTANVISIKKINLEF